MAFTEASIQDALIAYAEQNGLRPIDYAAAVGISETAARKWFDRKTAPSAPNLLNLCVAFPGIGKRMHVSVGKQKVA